MIQARDIAEAWFLNLNEILDRGYRQDIERGSFEGTEYRLQAPFIAGMIEFPCTGEIVPAVPLGIPSPTTHEYIERYFRDKILGSVKGDNEEYTYGERILLQLEKAVAMLMESSQTNQAVIEIGQPSDIDLPDPPCLRCITLKVVKKNGHSVLNLASFWRSWDAWAGFPSNLGGLVLLQKYICGFLEGIRPGWMFYSSDGMHLYGYEEELAREVTKKNG